MEKNIDLLITKILNSEASPEEILQFSAWLNADNRNEIEFRRIKSYWQAEVMMEDATETLTSLEKLTKALDKKKRNKAALFSYGVAAAITLLTISFSIFYLKEKDAGETIRYYTYLTSNNKSEITLDDGSMIILNKNSQLTYTNQYGKDNRNVQLTGEGYFDVARDTLNPFVLTMGESRIQVLGTKFNAKALSGDSEIITTLIEGAIQFQNAEQNILLYPDQQLTYNTSSRKISINPVKSTDFTAWTGNILKYRSVPFFKLVKELSEIYETEIIINNASLKKEELTVSAAFDESQTLEEVLRVISRSLPIKWHKKGGVFYIQ